jgi:hypothetical protein
MSKVGRIIKSQEAIKNAFIELMSEKNFDEIMIRILPTVQMLAKNHLSSLHG